MSTLAKPKKYAVYVCVFGERERELKCGRQDAKIPVPWCTLAVRAFLLVSAGFMGMRG